MKKHRLANDPPSGRPASGRRLSLCGRYLLPRQLTIESIEVDCESCWKAEVSERTIRQNRIADRW